MNTNIERIEHVLTAIGYRPLIQGEAAELLIRVESQKAAFPKSVEVFGTLLRTHLKRHPLLEDWLIIPHFQFFWDADVRSLKWFEDLFDESMKLIGIFSWEQWQVELLSQTDCPTTHALCDRLYDYQLQLYGGLYLARDHWAVEFIPPSSDEKSPDVRGTRKKEKCVLECKFIHTSEKYESFWRRFHKTARKYAMPSPPVLFCEEFKLPSALKIKSLTPNNCTVLKEFIRKVYENPSYPQIGIFGATAFAYNTSLPPALVPIDSQYEFAQHRGDVFASQYLKQVLDDKSLQLKKQEYSGHKKILFIGLQSDALYLAFWNEPVISNVKSSFKRLADAHGIKVVFSEDVDFPVRNYA